MNRYRTDLIRWRQEETGKSNQQIERETGRSRNTMRRVLNDENVTVDVLSDVCVSLSIELKHLFDFRLPLSQAKRIVVNNGHRKTRTASGKPARRQGT